MSKIGEDIAAHALWELIKRVGEWLVAQKVVVAIVAAITAAIAAWRDFQSPLITIGAALWVALALAALLAIFDWQRDKNGSDQRRDSAAR